MTETREIVVPGERVGKADQLRPGQNTYQEGDGIYALRLGVKTVRGDRVNVISLSGRYEPFRGDMVIGTVAEVGPSNWYINIGSANDVGMHVNDVPWRVEFGETSKYLAVGDTVLLKIVHVDEMKKAQVSMKDRQCRKLTGGIIFDVAPTKVPRIVGRNGSMIQLIKDATNVRLFVGQNGHVWLDGESEDVALALEALRKIEAEAHTTGLTDRMKAWLEDKRPSEKRVHKQVEEEPAVAEEASPERPRRERRERSDDRPPRRMDDDRPPRREREERPMRRMDAEAPPMRREREERPPMRREMDERPRREFRDEERPPRRDDNERPMRRDDRPPRREMEDRPRRESRDSDERPPRREFEDRPARRSDEERPTRRRDEDEEPRSGRSREDDAESQFGRGPVRSERPPPYRRDAAPESERPARRFPENDDRPRRAAPPPPRADDEEDRPMRRASDDEENDDRPARRDDREGGGDRGPRRRRGGRGRGRGGRGGQE